MLRIVLIFLLLALAAIGAVWLAERPEDVVLIWQGQRIETSIAVVATGIVLIAAALAMLWSLIRFVGRLPHRLGAGAKARRRERGFAAVSKGLMAVGAGDNLAAQRHAKEARHLVGDEPLALLLEAQSAQLSGDRAAAHRAFDAMTRANATRVLGWRGLFIEAKRSGDDEAARKAASEAVKIAPAAAWANEAMLAEHLAHGDWSGARRSLEQAERLRILDKATAKRQRAVLIAAEAQDVAAVDSAQALTLAREAADLAPDLVPAVALAARLLAERGDLRRAGRLIEAAWKTSPHPDLADVYVNLRAGDSALDRLQRAQALAKIAPDDPESAYAVARAALDARELAAARAALAPFVADRPTARICLIMADLADLAGDDQGETRHWLARAARAPRDKAWIGDGFVSDRWLPASPASGRLDAFVWAAPPERLAADEAPPLNVPDGAIAESVTDAAPVESIVIPPAPDPTPASPPARPTPVVFPAPRPPDDPGPKTAAPGRWRVFNG